MCKITMTAERTTKNTVRFTEVLEGKLTNPVIGTIYVPKDTLKALSWAEGDDITLEISSAGKPAQTKSRKTAASKIQKVEKSAPTKAVKKSARKVVKKAK